MKIRRSRLVLLLLTSVAFARGQSPAPREVPPERLDASIVRIVGAQTVPVRLSGNAVGNFVERLYRVRVLDSNRFSPGDEFCVVAPRERSTPEPEIGGTFLTSTYGEPSLSVVRIGRRWSHETRRTTILLDEDGRISTEDPADRTLWTDFLLPTREARLTARGRDGEAYVANLLAALAGMTPAELRHSLRNGLFGLTDELTRDPEDSPVRSETAFSRGVRRIAERSPLVKATVLQGLLEFRHVRGADRAYGLLLLRLAREPSRTWSLEEVDTPDDYGARFWRGDPRQKPPAPILPEEAVTALEGLRYPEFARPFATYAGMLSPGQTKRLRAALARMTPELRAKVREALMPATRAAVDAASGR